ncbi:MAG: hypothetical protein WC358_10750 [Ignavibacteria bacterium]|jgi:hypothetical protein
MKKLNPYIKILLIFIGSSIIFSCTAPTDLTNWRDASYTKKFKKVLVVALIKDLEFRKAYEGYVSQAFIDEGLTAQGSLNLLPFDSKISKADLENVLFDGKYDGLMLMKYTGTKESERVHSYYDYYDNWYTSPSYIEKFKTVNMETALFSVEKKKLIWVGESKTKYAYSADILAQSVADEIIVNLKEEKLIK